MNMNSYSYMTRALQWGGLLWVAGTIGIRLAGQYLLRPHRVLPTTLLYLISFMLMAWVVRRICQRLQLERELWFKATTLLILPTAILDPFSCLFFPRVFPNVDPAAAGIFGGWMLICCGGAIAGAWFQR